MIIKRKEIKRQRDIGVFILGFLLISTAFFGFIDFLSIEIFLGMFSIMVFIKIIYWDIVMRLKILGEKIK